jgi:hypothetical protein
MSSRQKAQETRKALVFLVPCCGNSKIDEGSAVELGDLYRLRRLRGLERRPGSPAINPHWLCCGSAAGCAGFFTRQSDSRLHREPTLA